MFIGSNLERNNCSENWLRPHYSLNLQTRKAYFAPLQYKLKMVAPQISMEEVKKVKNNAILGGRNNCWELKLSIFLQLYREGVRNTWER